MEFLLMFAIATGIIAKCVKNRSFLGWALVGFLLGPSGIVIAALMPHADVV